MTRHLLKEYVRLVLREADDGWGDDAPGSIRTRRDHEPETLPLGARSVGLDDITYDTVPYAECEEYERLVIEQALAMFNDGTVPLVAGASTYDVEGFVDRGEEETEVLIWSIAAVDAAGEHMAYYFNGGPNVYGPLHRWVDRDAPEDLDDDDE